MIKHKNKETGKEYEIPELEDKTISFAGTFKLENLIAELYDTKILPKQSGVYVPAEQYETGIKGEHKDKDGKPLSTPEQWINANPFNAKWDKLPAKAQKVITDAFYAEAVKQVPGEYFPKEKETKKGK